MSKISYNEGIKVFAYRNLHKQVWSIKALEGQHKGKVILHCEEAYLVNCSMKVSEAGRQRVIKSKSKNVHAGVYGTLIAADVRTERYPVTTSPYVPVQILYSDTITYNPYVHTSFVYVKSGLPVSKSNLDIAMYNNMTIAVVGFK